MPMSSTYYFIFGSEGPHKNKYVKIVGTFDSARSEMIRRYGHTWRYQLTSVEAIKYLEELKI